MSIKSEKPIQSPATPIAATDPKLNNTNGAVLVSLLYIINKAIGIVTSRYPGAICVQAAPLNQLQAIPNSYIITFRAADGINSLTIEAVENTGTGNITWSGITEAGPILGVGGNLAEAVVDIYPALKAIRRAGYMDPVFFCGLFQAVVPHIYQPWYCFTPNNCSSTSSSNYIFVNSITAEVRLFPTEQFKA